MAFLAPPLPPSAQGDDKDRLRWAALFIQEANRCGIQAVRVGYRIDGAQQAGSTNWVHIAAPPQAPYALRSVLPNQIIFDLGDDIVGPSERKPQPWLATRGQAHALADACHALGVPFHLGLSSGKGLHLEVFLDPAAEWASRLSLAGSCAECGHGHEGDRCREPVGLSAESRCPCRDFRRCEEAEDRRWPVARAIVAEANRILGVEWPAKGVVFDPLLIAPHEGSRLVREWGERKSPLAPHRKVLWHEGAGPMPRLPDTREAAYAQAEAMAAKRGSCRPSSIQRAHAASALDSRWVRDLFGAGCPQGPQCHSPEGDWPICEGCPIGGD